VFELSWKRIFNSGIGPAHQELFWPTIARMWAEPTWPRPNHSPCVRANHAWLLPLHPIIAEPARRMSAAVPPARPCGPTAAALSPQDFVEKKKALLCPSCLHHLSALQALSATTDGSHVGSYKMHIFTANIPTFHSRYRRYVIITNEFYEFY
jgi:hypothetical protein